MSYYYLLNHYQKKKKEKKKKKKIYQGKRKSESVPGHTASNLSIFTSNLGLKMGILHAKLQKQDYKTWV